MPTALPYLQRPRQANQDEPVTFDNWLSRLSGTPQAPEATGSTPGTFANLRGSAGEFQSRTGASLRTAESAPAGSGMRETVRRRRRNRDGSEELDTAMVPIPRQDRDLTDTFAGSELRRSRITNEQTVRPEVTTANEAAALREENLRTPGSALNQALGRARQQQRQQLEPQRSTIPERAAQAGGQATVGDQGFARGTVFQQRDGSWTAEGLDRNSRRQGFGSEGEAMAYLERGQQQPGSAVATSPAQSPAPVSQTQAAPMRASPAPVGQAGGSEDRYQQAPMAGMIERPGPMPSASAMPTPVERPIAARATTPAAPQSSPERPIPATGFFSRRAEDNRRRRRSERS